TARTRTTSNGTITRGRSTIDRRIDPGGPDAPRADGSAATCFLRVAGSSGHRGLRAESSGQTHARGHAPFALARSVTWRARAARLTHTTGAVRLWPAKGNLRQHPGRPARRPEGSGSMDR